METLNAVKSGTAHIAVSFGNEGYKAAAAWLHGTDPFCPKRHVVALEANAETLAKLQAIIGGAGTGYRLLLAGPAAEVRAARAQALGAGAGADMVVLLPTAEVA
ncbi:hypothetical protein ACFQ36_19685 [Arthrobacter sp. GCM10027362]|uniref:hypothetical protein n=1 Tax=Arthrobacter sp. GCM10027362 TaxID=3273379 RepID=UPI00362DB2E1